MSELNEAGMTPDEHDAYCNKHLSEIAASVARAKKPRFASYAEAEAAWETGALDDEWGDWLCRGNASPPIGNGDMLIDAMERGDGVEAFLESLL